MKQLSVEEAVLQSRAVANVEEAFRRIARHDPRGAIEEVDGLTMVATSIPYPLFNSAFLSRPPTDPVRLAERMRQFYARAGVTGLLLAAEREVEWAAPLIEAAQLDPGSPIPGMLLAPIPDALPASAALEIRVVDDLQALRLYNDTLAAGYGLPREWLTIFDAPETLRIHDMVFYLGFLAGAPVATSMCFTSHRIAGIFNVATLPEYRRRGLGAAMTGRAVRDGRDAGCLASALQASEQGFPVYARMGYRHVTDYETWAIK